MLSDAIREFSNSEACAASIYKDHKALLSEQSGELLEKLNGLVRLIDKVERTAKEQAVLIMNAMVKGEKECEVDSLFALGTKIHFIHGGDVVWNRYVDRNPFRK